MAVIVGLQAAVTGRDRDPAETAAQSPAVAAKMPVSTQSGASMRTLLPILLLVSVACRTDPAKLDTAGASDDTGPELVDADGDGYDESIDCDDEDASIHPGADEQCDGLDNDCDGDIDEEGGSLWYADGDGDGYGDPEDAVTACEAPSGFVGDSSDCDDGDPEVHPDAPERCDGLDNDCDGEIDEDLAELWHIDADGDGFGDPDLTIDSCDPGEGWVEPAMATDCDDGDAAVNPDAEEVCNGVDDDCDGAVDEDLESTFYADADGDGFGDPDAMLYGCEPAAGYTTDASDCDDANSGIHPDADELCDTLDNDCDGLIDDADPSIGDASTWYTDADGDGYGDDGSSTTACEQPSGTAALGGDCDDADPAYNPGAVEDDCTDPNDYNCDGSTGYADDDGDGYPACEECDDGDASVYPGATEYCDGADNDCDEDIDEDPIDGSTWFIDKDSDGYGSDASTMDACDQPSGYAATDTDCDDSDAAISPGVGEACDGIDNDCDGLVDDDDTGIVDPLSWYADADTDSYGDPSVSTTACDQPSGYVADDTDCDDSDASIYPGAAETVGDLCFDTVDNDCDGDIDAVDSDCAACPSTCADEVCLYVDGVLEASQSTPLVTEMASINSLVLRQASFDDVIVGAAGTVLVAEDFTTGIGCFTGGTVSSGALEAGAASPCTFTGVDLSAGDWVVSVDVLAGKGDAALSLMDIVDSGSGWSDWTTTPVLDDGEGNTTAFTSGAPSLAADHQVVMCGMSP